ncbi:MULTISPECIES: DUF3052 domain-containing protein [Aquimarina]|nr:MULTISPECIES: DUF3052 domain-containing protein [Aquimarina]
MYILIVVVMAAGYSGTALSKKLGIKEGYTIALYNQPDYYFDLFSDLPENVINTDVLGKETVDFAHLFCTTFIELSGIVTKYKPAIKKHGMLWVSWPKGSSKIVTDLKRDMIREYLIHIGLVDVKVAAIDDDWSGLKFVYRTKDR